MSRWIAFDTVSAAAIGAAAQTAPELHHGDALSAALASNRPAVVVTPSNAPGRALVLQVRRPPGADELRPIGYEITGFLGLVDQPIFEEAPTPPKKWWQKILD